MSKKKKNEHASRPAELAPVRASARPTLSPSEDKKSKKKTSQIFSRRNWHPPGQRAANNRNGLGEKIMETGQQPAGVTGTCPGQRTAEKLTEGEPECSRLNPENRRAYLAPARTSAPRTTDEETRRGPVMDHPP